MATEHGSILYVQYTNPAGYPPLQHSSRILADAGWNVQFLGTDVEGVLDLQFPPHDRITVDRMSRQPDGWRQKLHYLGYAAWVVRHALARRPDWAYVSDPLATPIGLLLSAGLGIPVVYHEHDLLGKNVGSSPFMKTVAWARRRLARQAEVCVLPNEKRLAHFEKQTGCTGPTYCVWNCPAQSEAKRVCSGRPSRTDGLPKQTEGEEDDFVVYYHGTLTPKRVPLAVVEALDTLPECVRVKLVGYETEGHSGYVRALRSRASELGIAGRLSVHDARPRHALFEEVRGASIGLSFMPENPADFNLNWMVGASNKPFDYLACGVPLLVSDLPDWVDAYVRPGYARACDPQDPQSIADAIRWYLDHPEKRREMGRRGRRRILDDWNYEHQFKPVFDALQ